jgi:hypothetical protein
MLLLLLIISTDEGMVTEVRPVHPEKAAFPIEVTFDGRAKDVSPEQF